MIPASSPETRPRLLTHDWSRPPVVHTEWATDVIASGSTLAEERRGLVGRPRRTLSLRWVSLGRGQANRLLLGLARAMDEDTLVPLYPDAVVSTGPASGDTIPCPTTHRRFAAGGRVAIGRGSPGELVSVQVRTITAVADDALTVGPALDGEVAAGAVVVPLLVCRALLEATVTAQTDHVLELAVDVGERLDQALPRAANHEDLAALGFAQAEFGEEGDVAYVLDPRSSWRTTPTLRLARAGRVERLGRDEAVLVRGPRALMHLAFSVLCRSREEWARLLAFFDAHRGALIPFVAVNPVTLWRAVAVAAGYVEVEADDTLSEAQGLATHVVVETRAGARHVRRVVVVAEFSTPTRYRISVAPELPALALSDVARVTSALLCRFAGDAMREEWHTASVCEVRIDVVELAGERAAGLAHATYPEPPCEVEPEPDDEEEEE
ncbi:MAG: hypothetical protein KIT58_00190 [Planctomycetota bacterium]|nr:hypothetical protein [Planctomycetota bacterium]